MAVNDVFQEVENFLRKEGVVTNQKNDGELEHLYIRRRVQISVLYSIVSVAALGILLYQCCAAGGSVSKVGYCMVLGLIGLAFRSWSHIDYRGSPFPPYVATYPVMVLAACATIAAVAAMQIPEQHSGLFYLAVAWPCFAMGYGPMDALRLHSK